jgi:hypothetical protein
MSSILQKGVFRQLSAVEDMKAPCRRPAESYRAHVAPDASSVPVLPGENILRYLEAFENIINSCFPSFAPRRRGLRGQRGGFTFVHHMLPCYRT